MYPIHCIALQGLRLEAPKSSPLGNSIWVKKISYLKPITYTVSDEF